MCRVAIVLVALFAFTYGFRRAPVSFPKPDERIIGGENVNIEDVPYQLVVIGGGGWPNCGASIISANWALTGVQCVGGSDPSQISLRAGSSFRDRGGSVHQAIKIIAHKKALGGDYNYAVVQVAEPFPLGQAGVQAVRLAETEPAVGTTVVASGFGSIFAGEATKNHIQRVNQSIISRGECEDLCEDTDITSRLICAGRNAGDFGTSPGDAGGPLVSNGEQVGIAIYGMGCGKIRPGIYSNVADQREWIRENTGV